MSSKSSESLLNEKISISGPPPIDENTGDSKTTNNDTSQVCLEPNPDSKSLPVSEISPTSIPLGSVISTQEAWKLFTKQFAEADKVMVEGWKEDMDGLLIFSGLFSAVVTTFVVDSYRSLQQDSSVITNQILAQISLQLASFSLNAGTVNSTVGPIDSGILNAPFPPPSTAVRVNALWFVSLIFSIGASALAISIRQWLREFLRPPLTLQIHDARLRQFRSKNLSKWCIPYMVVSLPVLLQISLAMFFIGLLIQLWTLDTLIFQIATGFVVLTLVFLLGTSLLPAFFIDCPYRSPQAYALYWCIQVTITIGFGIFIILMLIPVYFISVYTRFSQVADFILRPLAKKFDERPGVFRTGWEFRDTRSHLLKSPLLESEFLAQADWNFSLDDEKMAHGLVACLNDMQYVDAARTLKTLVSQGSRGNRGFVILMEKISSMLPVLSTKNQEEQKQMLRVVKQVNSMLNKDYWERSSTVLNHLHDMEHHLAGALLKAPDDTSPDIHRRLCSTLVDALAISISSQNMLKFEQDPVVFDSLVSKACVVLDTRELSSLFYKCCTTILNLCLKVPISDDTLSQRRDSLLSVIQRFKTHLQQHGFCDTKGQIGNDLHDCYLELATTLLDDLIAFAERYPDSDFVDPITRVIEVYTNRILGDMGDICVDTMTYYDKHSASHNEKYELERRGKEWTAGHPLVPDERLRLVRSNAMTL